MERIRQQYTLSREKLETISQCFLNEMEKGLCGEPSTISMIPSYVTKLPTGIVKIRIK